MIASWIHYWAELALWMTALFFVGCGLGAALRGARGAARPGLSATASVPPDGDR